MNRLGGAERPRTEAAAADKTKGTRVSSKMTVCGEPHNEPLKGPILEKERVFATLVAVFCVLVLALIPVLLFSSSNAVGWRTP